MLTTTTSNEVNTPTSPDGYQVGAATTALVGFWGKAPVDQPSSLTAQLTTITMADTAGTPDYSFAAVTTTSAGGASSAQEFISLLYVVRNLQVRLAEVESRLEECGIVAAN